MQNHIHFFKDFLGSNALIDAESLEKYSHDETEDISVIPAIVLKPSTTEEVSKIMAYCHEHKLIVTPSGARTGLSGGAIPSQNGIALSM